MSLRIYQKEVPSPLYLHCVSVPIKPLMCMFLTIVKAKKIMHKKPHQTSQTASLPYQPAVGSSKKWPSIF